MRRGGVPLVVDGYELGSGGEPFGGFSYMASVVLVAPSELGPVADAIAAVTGLTILIALLVAGPWLAPGALLGVVSATATAALLGLDRDTRRAGLSDFNGTLVGAGQ